MAWYDALESISIVAAAVAAIAGINAWKKEFIGRKKIEVAEELLLNFYQAKDALERIRSPFTFGHESESREKEDGESSAVSHVKDQQYVVFKRYNENVEIFQKIDSIRYRVLIYIGLDRENIFTELRKIINEVLFAARMLHKYWIPGTLESEKEYEEWQAKNRKCEEDIWDGGEDNELTIRISKLVEDVEKICRPIIQGKSEPNYIHKWYNSICAFFKKFKK